MEWIKCSDYLPSRGKWVLVIIGKYDDPVIAKRAGWFRPYWKYQSGLSEFFISASDQWLKLPEFPEN